MGWGLLGGSGGRGTRCTPPDSANEGIDSAEGQGQLGPQRQLGTALAGESWLLAIPVAALSLTLLTCSLGPDGLLLPSSRLHLSPRPPAC